MFEPVKVLCTLGLRGTLEELAAKLADRGCLFDAAYGSSNALMRRLASGETADAVLLTDAAIDELVAQGKIVTGSRVDLARSGVGIAVRAGAPKPDISTPEAFKRALLEARSIAYTVSGASGIHFAQVIERLGIADDIKAKAHIQDGVVGALAADGTVEIAVQQISELKLVAGIDIVGPLPEPLQKRTVFSAGMLAMTGRPDATKALIEALAGPDVAAVLQEKGLEPLAGLVTHKCAKS